MATINQLIKDNRDIILNIEKNSLNQQKTLTEDEFYQYEGFLREKIYQQINYIFIALETRKCTIIEKKYLIEQIPLLSQLLFDYLDGENEDYWRVTQQQSWDFFNYDYTFIQPKDFTKEYILEKVQELTDNKNKTEKAKPTNTIQQYFHNLKNTDSFLQDLKTAFPTEIGLSIRAIIDNLQNESILIIPYGKYKNFVELLGNYFQRNIGSYASIQNIKEVHPETSTPIEKILKPLITKHKVN